jgi:hypothetical protein
MRQYQRLLRDLLDPSDWQTEDKNGNPLERPFLKKSGWRKIARAFNLSFERVDSRVEREEDGTGKGGGLDQGGRAERPVQRRRRLLLGRRGPLQEPEGGGRSSKTTAAR